MKTIYSKIFFFIFSLLLSTLTSCSSVASKESQKESVSLNAALNLSRASYLRGCMEEIAKSDLKNKHDYCLNKANKFLSNDVESILNQK